MGTVSGDGRHDGEARKESAHRLLERHRGRLILRGRRVLLAKALQNGTATIDDVRAEVEVPAGISPKLFGPVPAGLAAENVIRHVGYTKTARAVGHARPVSVWEVADRHKAAEWLRDHPEPPDEPEAPVAVACG